MGKVGQTRIIDRDTRTDFDKFMFDVFHITHLKFF